MRTRPRLLALSLLLALLTAAPTAAHTSGLKAEEAEEEECIFGCDAAHTTVLYEDTASALTFADLNGDGLKDIVIADVNVVFVLARTDLNSSWETVFQQALTDTVSAGFPAVAAADMDGDGSLDLVVAAKEILIILFNNGDGTSYDMQYVTSCLRYASGLAVFDIDGDGDEDMVVSESSTVDLKWQENYDGSGNAWVGHTIGSGFNGASWPIAADANGDGFKDVFTVGFLDSTLRVHLNLEGDGNHWYTVSINSTTFGSAGTFFDVGDLNGDDKPDIFLAKANDQIAEVYLNIDGYTWTMVPVASGVYVHGHVSIGDMDADGDLDLVLPLDPTATVTGPVPAVPDDLVWFENVDGTGTNWIMHQISVNPPDHGAHHTWTTDIDDDGDTDLLVSVPTGSRRHLVLMESNLDITATVTAAALPGSCTLENPAPVCATITEAVEIAGNRPLTVQLVDEVVQIDNAVEIDGTAQDMPAKLTIVGMHPSGRTMLNCKLSLSTCFLLRRLRRVVIRNLHTDGSGRAFRLERVLAASFDSCYIGHRYTTQGGAIYAEWSSLELSDSVFEGNYAASTGGAIFMKNSQLQARECLFRQNYASQAGGAIYWEGTSPPELQNVTFDDNWPEDLASGVTGVAFAARPVLIQQSGVPLAAEGGGPVEIQAVDFYGRLITTNIGMTATVAVTTLSGTVTSSVNKPSGLAGQSGKIIFEDLAVHGVVSTNLLRFDVVLGTDMQQSLDATIELAQCLPGFYRDYEELYLCKPCSAGQFSSKYETTQCQSCDEGYYCDGGATDPNQHPCPAGTFGSTKGLGSAACTADCTAGYFCPPASTTDMVQPCGVGYYCPSGTDVPKPIEPGYCWVGSSEEHAEAQELCLYIDTVIPMHGPTTGGIALTIGGGQFENVTVSVGGKACPIDEEHSDLTQLVCTVPEGLGAHQVVEVVSHHRDTTSPLSARFSLGFSYIAPHITSVTGCDSSDSPPRSCRTRGGSILTIHGTNFGNDPNEISVVLRGSNIDPSKVSLVVPHEQVTVELPPGVGSNVVVTIAVAGQLAAAVGFSYAAPTVTSVTGCMNTSASGAVIADGTMDCPRNPDGVVLTIHGQNFGYEGVQLLLGGKECTQLSLGPEVDADTTAACLLPPGSGDAVTVNVLQNNGRLSPALPFVMYEACPPGTYNHWDSTLGYFTCDPCLPLTYSDSFQAYECSDCPPGNYMPDATSCLSCDDVIVGSTSPATSTSPSDCVCPPTKALNLNETACVCPPGTFHNPTTKQCQECPVDTYSDAYEDNLACSSCPLGASTHGATGASTPSACECEAANGMVPDGFACTCEPGFFYKSVENRCQACSVGLYLPYESLDSACLSCQDVVSGSTTPQAGTSSADDCLCPEGSYFEPATSATHPQLRGRCVECPHGAVCPAGSDLASIKLRPGYWRTSGSSSDVKACENPDACIGGEGAGACAEGYTGPVCAVCDDGYSEGTHYRECTPCDAVLLTRVLMVLIFIVLPVVWLLAFVWVNAARIRNGSKSTTPSRPGLLERWFVVDWSVYDKVVGSNMRLLVVYYQILASFVLFAGFSYPDSFDGFLTYLSVLNLDVISTLGFGCSLHVNYFDNVIFVTLAPLALVGLIALIYIFNRFHIFIHNRKLNVVPRKIQRSLVELRSLFALAALLVLYFVLPGVSASLFAVFGCVEFDDNSRRLRADYSIDCDSPQYHGFLGYTTIMLIVYPLGTTLVTAWLLFMNRLVIHPPKTTTTMAIQQRSDNERLRAFSFLFAPYKPEYWWFEMFECVRRVTLASIPVLVLGSSTIQVVLAAVVCFTALVVLVATKPYLRQLENMYACGAQLALFLVCFIGLLLKYGEASADSDDVAALVMICANALFVTVAGIAAIQRFTGTERIANRFSEADAVM